MTKGLGMKTVLTNCNLIDCLSPTVIPNASVVIDDKRISYAGTSLGDSDANSEVTIDVNGAWVSPGLFDVHSHMVSPVHRPLNEDFLDKPIKVYHHYFLNFQNQIYIEIQRIHHLEQLF